MLILQNVYEMSAKKFSNKVMEFPVTVFVSKGMYQVLKELKKKTGESYSNYIRTLIMNDQNIDYNGKEINPR